MGAQDRTEKVLRDIHVLFSKAEPVENSKKRVIVDKDEIMGLLTQLNSCIYDIMDEYELTKQSRDKANREMQKQGDEIIFKSSRKAEDIYAASIMYTDNALNAVQDIMKEATDQISQIYQETEDKMKEEARMVRSNQSELKGQLQDLIDTQKYLHLIEDENARIAKEKEAEEEHPKARSTHQSQFASLQPEIRVNKEYFAQAGIPIEEEDSQSESDLEQAALSEDLDKEYFQWKEEDTPTEETRKDSVKGILGLFGKK